MQSRFLIIAHGVVEVALLAHTPSTLACFEQVSFRSEVDIYDALHTAKIRPEMNWKATAKSPSLSLLKSLYEVVCFR